MTLEPKDENIPVQSLMEGWVYFDRFYCTEGYIDRWIGNFSQNPNKQFMSSMMSNSIKYCYRLNNDEWIDGRCFESDFFNTLIEYRKYFTAREIFWNGVRSNYK